MKALLNFRDKIEHFYKQHSRIMGYILRVILCAASLLLLGTNLKYNTFLSNIWVIIVISVLSSLLPLKIMLLVLLAYIVVQTATLSLGVGLLMAGIMLVMYFLYLRYADAYGYVLILMPLMFIIKIPLVVPLVLAVIAPGSAVISLAFGIIMYYFIHYININSAVISGMPADVAEITKAGMVFRGVFSYREFLYTLCIMVLVFMLVFFLKKLNINQSFALAVVAGTGFYLVLMIIATMVFGGITSGKLISLIVSSLISLIIAVFIVNIVLPLDYSRTEFLEFEDEEYYYFVRAVPKANIAKETVRIKRINTRKEGR